MHDDYFKFAIENAFLTPSTKEAFIKTQRLISSPEWQQSHQTVLNAFSAMSRNAWEMMSRNIVPLNDTFTMTANDKNGWLILGAYFSTLGKFNDAIFCYQNVLQLDNTSSEARLGLVILNESSETKELLNIANGGNIKEQISANFALGRLHDKKGEYDIAFQFFKIANDLTKTIAKPFKRNEFETKVANIIQKWNEIPIYGNPSSIPVFIMGFPRSGSTLIEQILVSHPEVATAGELTDIMEITRDFNLNETFIKRQAKAHLERLKTYGTCLRVIDKLPDNILHVGEILTLFPNAKIIIASREMRDTCLSCYFQNFGGINWANDLSDIVFRFEQVINLIEHWKTSFPVLQISYEDLIENVEEKSKEMVNFIGLQWNDDCLDFHKTERQILTSSLWQARLPLYKNKIGYWENYQNHVFAKSESKRL